MKGFIKDIWWILILRGLAILLFGLSAVVWPGLTFVTLSVFFAVYVLVTGIADILMAIGAATQMRAWFLTLLLGIIEVSAGVFLLKNPAIILPTFISIVGITVMMQGIFAVIVSFIDTRDSGMKLLEIVSGILGVVAGFLVLRYPVSGGIAFVWVLGVYGIIAGTLSIAMSLSLKQTVDEVENILSPRKSIAK